MNPTSPVGPSTPSKLGIYVFGHGGGVPQANAGNTNFALIPTPTATGRAAIETDRFWLLDVGPETLLDICGSLGGPPCVQNLDGIVLTHAHADHAGGLAGLAWRFRFFEKRRVKLVAPAAIWPMLVSQLVELRFASPTELEALGHRPELSDYYDLVTLSETSCDISDELSVSAFPVDHNITSPDGDFPAYGLRVTRRSGPSVVFSGDTARVVDAQRLEPFAAMFHDCQFYDPTGEKAVHCPYPALRDQLPADVRQRTWLAHTLWEPPPETSEAGFRWAGRSTYLEL